MPPSGLSARGLRRVWRGRTVVDGVDLSVSPGDVVGLLGPNGAGKTTCFRILAGLDPDGQGEVMLNNQRLGGLPLWRRVRLGLGYLPQEPSVFRGLSVRDNLLLPLQERGAAAELDARLAEAGLESLAGHLAGTLSGGERRRLELARCLATRPSVLLLDEPFSGVDPVAVSDLQRRIRALTQAGIGVLLTDHAVREALNICTTALLLDAGRVMVAGTPQEVASNAHARARYLGADFHLDPPR